MASITELKARLSKYIKMVRRGGEVQILERGVPVARLVGMASVSAEDEEARLERLVRSGVLRRGAGDARAMLDRPPVRAPGADVSAALQEDREDRV